jgi:hypothetical protein
VAGGLSPNQLRTLRDEYGSLAAAIEARPDLADQLRGVQRMAEKFGRQAEALKRMTESIPPALTRAPELKTIDVEAMTEHQIEMRATAYERALARHARSEARKRVERTERSQLSDKQKLLHKHYPNAKLAKVLALLEQREKVSAIAEETGLNRQDVDKIKVWREMARSTTPWLGFYRTRRSSCVGQNRLIRRFLLSQAST